MRELYSKAIPLLGRNATKNVIAMEAVLTANRSQHQQRKNPLLEEAARARTIGPLSVAFPTVELVKKPSPRRQGKRRH